jgi:hypothetical protein
MLWYSQGGLIDMKENLQNFYQQVNHARYSGQQDGFYESFFQRANHQDRPMAFWIRYTLFSPKAKPEEAIGELWAVFFNGETNQHVAVKKEVPFKNCLFDSSTFKVRVGDAQLSPNSLAGSIQADASNLSWDLSFEGSSDPLLLLPYKLYATKLPAAKSLVSLPMATYSGKINVNGTAIDIHKWIGSQNHNWGIRHTDLYAWGQVAGFDTHPDSFLELATARLKIGPFWTPPITPIVLRHKDKEYTFNGLLQAVRADGEFEYFSWKFKSETPRLSVEGTISAPKETFVGLQYYNPPGGAKHCLNTKIASCQLNFIDKESGTHEILETKHRAAFEILTDDQNHGIPIAA